MPSIEDAQRCLSFALTLADILFVLPGRVPGGSKNPSPGHRAIEAPMHSRLTVVLGIGLWVSAAGCATATTHFASGQHGIFSLRNNRDGSNPRVSRADIAAGQTESWWGKVITVSPEQIFEPR
jgi:hypothetical protein